MDSTDRKKAAKQFVENWRGRGYEKGDAQVFWTELLQSVVGMKNVSQQARFEYRAPNGGFIDCLIPDAGVLIEQKGLGVDLDKPEERQGRMVTPLEQALAYAEGFPRARQPRFIVVCNFGEFRVHDRDVCTREELPQQYLGFTLDELAESPHLLNFITDPSNSRAEKEKRVSVEAGRLIGELHAMLQDKYINPESAESQHALNVLCVRLVFCLFCEDAGLFPKDAFLDYLKGTEPADMRNALKRLFRALDTPPSERDPYDERIKPFPYVNGGLFQGEEEIPNFDNDIKYKLLFETSQQVDWSDISPTVFGGIFESTLNPETRRAGGMHYTSPENIHKVIDPLFLDELREEFDAIKKEEGLTPRKRKAKLKRFRTKLAGLKFLDPACGSGNFLTETYISLRRLEDDVLAEMNDGQVELAFGFDNDGATPPPEGLRVSLAPVYGIEINDFAARVARTALWIAKLQADGETDMLFDTEAEDFPLTDSANIVEANALRIDWNDVLPAAECSYIMGNPPFVGYSNLTDDQKKDRADIFGKSGGTLDYVACWYRKAADYIKPCRARCAFVSTNSICQGQQVEPLWRPLFKDGIHIDFAYRTFAWGNEAADQAHVHVVIVGFSRESVTPKLLFNADGPASRVENINAYLSSAPNFFISKRSKPLCDVPEMAKGFQATDNGNLLLSPKERDELLAQEPQAERWIRPFSMGGEFVNGQDRYCLWLQGVTSQDLKSMPLVRARVDSCYKWRCSQKPTGDAFKLRDTPHLLRPCGKFRDGIYIGVPKVTSGRRNYIPLGFVSNGMIPGDKLYFIPTNSLYIFGVLISQFHNAWMRVVAGRLKSDYSYGNTIVYNNFVWPNSAEHQRSYVERCAQAVLDARALYPDSTLADMYDPDNEWMFPELAKAHRELDAAVEAAYGVGFNGNEEKIVAHLFKLYAELTKED